MKKIAVLFVLLVMLAGFALPAFAQEDEPLTWQEQFWALFLQATSNHVEHVVYHLVLADLNQDGVQELVVLSPGTHRTTLVLVATMDGDVARAFELKSETGGPLVAFDSIWVDSQRDEIRLFGFSREPSFRFYDETLLCWETYTATAQPLEGVRQATRWHREEFAPNHFRSTHSSPFLRTGGRELVHLEGHWIGRNREGRVPIVFMSYDITRAAFFEALDILAPDGTLNAEPFTNATPATEFMQTSSFWAWWYRGSGFDGWRPFSFLAFFLLGVFSQKRSSKRRQQAPLTAIACVDRNWAIGHENQLLFQIPADMMLFRNTTMDNVVLMGRKTYDSLPKTPSGFPKLSGRTIVVVSRDTNFQPRGMRVHVRHTLEEAVTKAKSMGKKVFVVGGGVVYDALLPQCNTALITQVDTEAEQADVFFPNLDNHPDWHMTKTGDWHTHKGLRWRICVYSRRT